MFEALRPGRHSLVEFIQISHDLQAIPLHLKLAQLARRIGKLNKGHRAIEFEGAHCELSPVLHHTLGVHVLEYAQHPLLGVELGLGLGLEEVFVSSC